jgi:phosphoribosyl 1,2-cyclic phosphodiesterase
MRLRVLASGSAGNCYLLENDTECLIIEVGIRFEIIKQSLNFNLRNIVGALVSHEHQDHSKGVRAALLAGINCYMSEGTAKALQFEHHCLNIIHHAKPFNLGNFQIMAFDVIHDCAQPFGFLIKHPDSGVTCFLTDTVYSEFKFPGLNNIIVEANYCETIIKQRSEAGNLHGFLKDRVIQSHMSLQTCKQFLAENDLSKVVNILLIHLSDSNSDLPRFKKEVEQQTAKIVNVAEKGLSIHWGVNPF